MANRETNKEETRPGNKLVVKCSPHTCGPQVQVQTKFDNFWVDKKLDLFQSSSTKIQTSLSPENASFWRNEQLLPLIIWQTDAVSSGVY